MRINILVGGLEHFLFFHSVGMSSSQLTNSNLFHRVFPQPPTRDKDSSTMEHLAMISHGSPKNPPRSPGHPDVGSDGGHPSMTTEQEIFTRFWSRFGGVLDVNVYITIETLLGKWENHRTTINKPWENGDVPSGKR